MSSQGANVKRLKADGEFVTSPLRDKEISFMDHALVFINHHMKTISSLLYICDTFVDLNTKVMANKLAINIILMLNRHAEALAENVASLRRSRRRKDNSVANVASSAGTAIAPSNEAALAGTVTEGS